MTTPSSQQDDEYALPDADTLRIMISTDNHLGYAESDPIRGNDSFAAFEEVMYLARKTHCDLVLLAGDLFHENRPSRKTLYKTMDILRKYTLGPNPVQFQILSNPKASLQSSDVFNYTHNYLSIDLPIMCIHGNHDDPTRDEGSTDLLAALDLLAVSNMVNYFGRCGNDTANDLTVSPILIRKGEGTNVALYGLGNVRDERLNRTWKADKVKFQTPVQQGDEDDEGESSISWFNIFALHQNRDLGRGKNNCIHESMIPEWMDLVVWGHEHECQIMLDESLVGTFRITQPGSSVATSLSMGESVKKEVGILDIRGEQFRLTPIPLTQVRSFVMSEVSLTDPELNLDVHDQNLEQKLEAKLTRKLCEMIDEAQENRSDLLRDAKFDTEGHLKYRLESPDKVLVRLKVEQAHGFPIVSNQRFGQGFIEKVANPTDLLLFNRKKATGTTNPSKKKTSTAAMEPIKPQDLEGISIDDIICDKLLHGSKPLELLLEDKLTIALNKFVDKKERQSIDEQVANILMKQQRTLTMKKTEPSAIKEQVQLATQKYHETQTQTKKAKDDNSNLGPIDGQKPKPTDKAPPDVMNEIDSGFDSEKLEDDSEEERKPVRKTKVTSGGRNSSKKVEPIDSDEEEELEKSRARGRAKKQNTFSDEEVEEVAAPTRKRGRKTTASPKTGKKNTKKNISDEDSEVEVVKAHPQRKRGARAVASKSKANKEIHMSDSEEEPPKKKEAVTFTKRNRRKGTSSLTMTSKYAMSDDDSVDDGYSFGTRRFPYTNETSTQASRRR